MSFNACRANMPASSAARTAGFALYWILSLVVFLEPVRMLLALWWTDQRYAYVVLMPVVSAALLCWERGKIFRKSEYCPRTGIPLAILGIAAYVAVRVSSQALWLEVCALVVVWLAGFICFYGMSPFRPAAFPLALLLLTVPAPSPAMHMFETALQSASGEVAHVLFKLTGTPVFRNGLVFSLPGVDIEVARQCSGIRSTSALLITAIVASYILLRSGWSRACFILATVPIAILKNAVRITTLSWLAVHVSPDVLHGPLHRQGGVPFTLFALAILGPLLFALRRLETAIERRRVNGAELAGQASAAPPATR